MHVNAVVLSILVSGMVSWSSAKPMDCPVGKTASGISLLQTRQSRKHLALNRSMHLGVISYWPPQSGYYDTLPNGSMAVINPMNGVFAEQSMETLAPGIHKFQEIVDKAAARHIHILGYVPTGYFNHSCNVNAQCQTLERMEKQVEKYLDLFPNLAGIFFDEVAPNNWDCGAFVPEYMQLRQLVRKHSPNATIAWNAAVADNCAVAGAKTGEILVLFEHEEARYGNSDFQDDLIDTASSAHSRGIKTWHLVHTVSSDHLQAVLEKARLYQVDWFYATNIGGNWQAGENTWGEPPLYWDQLKMEFGWSPIATAEPTPVVVPTNLSATVHPSEIPVGGSAILTLNRPAAQCCNWWDWIGIYKTGSSERLGFVHSKNDKDHTVTLSLEDLITDLGQGEYEFKYSTRVDDWVMHDLPSATLEIHSEPFATVIPSEILVNSSSILTLNRPVSQCCVDWDWVGIYKKGSSTRLGFVHSHNGKDSTVALPLGSLLAGLAQGQYEFKYSTSVDDWAMHELSSATLEIHSEPFATIAASENSTGSSLALTLHRPVAQCCVEWDWIGIYKKGSSTRLGFVHSDNNKDHTVSIPLDNLVAGLAEGEYEFKYSTDVDGWVMHNLAATWTITR